MIYWSAIILGMVSNFHCLGMCGPLAMALPIHQYSLNQKLAKAMAYHFGRMISYGALGALFGFFGKSLELFGMQQLISMIIGVVILLSLVFPPLLSMNKIFHKVTSKWVTVIKKPFVQLLQKKSAKSLFLFGVLNGLLPCGMVYMALAGAINTTEWYQGTLFMILFGLGTLPVMLTCTMASSLLSKVNFIKIKKMIPAVVFLFGMLLVFRGANLDIPYLSPTMQSNENGVTLKCH